MKNIYSCPHSGLDLHAKTALEPPVSRLLARGCREWFEGQINLRRELRRKNTIVENAKCNFVLLMAPLGRGQMKCEKSKNRPLQA